MDFASWLIDLGLGECAAAFADNDVDDATLPRLTAEDLTEIGVLSVGHRRKLLDAIAQLDKQEPTKPEASKLDAASAIVAPERRQLTVMFCDLVGPIALSARPASRPA